MRLISLLLAATLVSCVPALGQRDNPPIELTGMVLERSLVRSESGAWRELATVQTADGRRVTVDFGPPGGEATIAQGERVKVTGRTAQRDGHPVVVAGAVVRVPGSSSASGGR
jgi:hypothetical protein